MEAEVKLYLYAAAALALGALVWFARHEHQRANAATARAKVAEASIVTLRKAHDHERKIAQEASNAYQSDLRRLQSERDKPLSVRVCKPASPARSVPAGSAAASGSSPTSPLDNGQETAGDIGPEIGDQLLEFGLACEANALQLDRLIEWVHAR